MPRGRGRLIMEGMEKRTREKIALVAFVLLVALAGIVLTSYFSTGRSWNVAASFVDDTIGSMDGYTVVAYAGTVDPEEDDAADEGVRDDEPSAFSDDGVDLGEGAAALADVASGVATSGGSSDAEGQGEAAADAPADAAADTTAEDAPLEDEVAAEQDADARATLEAGEDDGSLGLFSFLPSPFAHTDEYVHVSDVRTVYENKNANVLTLNAASSHYAEPTVLYVGSKRIGVYSTTGYLTKARIGVICAYFEEEDVDVVMFITPRTDLLTTYEDIDVVIVTTDQEEGLSPRGETREDTLVVRAPEKGEVGVVLLTTNNVASAKVVSSL